jgi:hypothetical protein
MDRDYILRLGPYTSLVPPTYLWNTHGKCIIDVRNHTRASISLTFLSPERNKWLHETLLRLHITTDFTHDPLRLMPRYHPRAKSLNPQGRLLKLANHWVILAPLRLAIESMFLNTSELFGIPLNCSMSDGITYCSAFSGRHGLRGDDRLFHILMDKLLHCQPGI